MHITFLLFTSYSKHILTPYQYGWVCSSVAQHLPSVYKYPGDEFKYSCAADPRRQQGAMGAWRQPEHSCICTRLNTGCGCRCVQQLAIRSDPDTLYLKLRTRQRTVALTARQRSRSKEESTIPLGALGKGEKRTRASSTGAQSGTAQNSFKTADLGPYGTGRHSRGPAFVSVL